MVAGSMKHLVEVEPAKEAAGGAPSAGPTYRCAAGGNAASPPAVPGLDCCWDIFRLSVEKYPDNKMLGRREIVDGKAGSYTWLTYKQVYDTVLKVGAAIRSCGVGKGGRCGIYGANSPEWVISMQACNAHGIYCVPLYDTLGAGAVEFVLCHAEVQIAFVEEKKIGEMLKTFPNATKYLKTIVSFGKVDPGHKEKVEQNGLSIYSWEEFLQLGGEEKFELPPKEKDDICTIMYTSGTTGDPKGVLISNKSIVTIVSAVDEFLNNSNEQLHGDDVYISYLPLAHIFDRVIEEVFIRHGASIGFWRGDVKLLVEDIGELKPTVFCAVPRVLDRIYGGLQDKITAGGFLKKTLFNVAYKYKQGNMLKGSKHEEAAALFDRLVFTKVKRGLGGRVRLILSGAAPLSRHVEEYLRVVTCSHVLQGYGLTETCAGSFVSLPNNMSMLGTVGPPVPYVEVRLESVPEMGYDALSSETPRGEICIRGDTLFSGYYKREDLTNEVLVDGWFHTGDIGEWQSDGSMKIIDRKKNIFKLSQGEYVAVENLENIFGQTPGVDSFPGATAPGSFRPVSLQNCPVKIITKILTTRLQKQIQKLVNIDQTGFIKGRSISENFVYAAELVQCCHCRKAPTLVLKLDFAKAFDSVSWSSLRAIMEARGFGSIWCNWIQHLLTTSKSAVLVNGCPGPWIKCERGLRQGDALSPYLFLLVADVLQAMIQEDGLIRHPIADDTCPVLQYADDTLIILRADPVDVNRLKVILDQFAMATGLKINFHKSTAVPMHVQDDLAHHLVDIMQCKKEGFPQVYLGLPLSNVKLRLSAFSPLVAKVDRYLSGWRAMLLSYAGRLTLVNSVLDGLPTYTMGAMVLPPGVIKLLDARRRAFLWAGSDKVSGAQCLVAWEKVCTERRDGGLGVKRLDTQNSCLLLKLIHRLHHPAQSSWAQWAGQRVSLADLQGEVWGEHWTALRSLLPAYQAITTADVGNGHSTSFWNDRWLGDKPLALTYPSLFTHSKDTGASVAKIIEEGPLHNLQPRLSRAAAAEMDALEAALQGVDLTQGPDQISCFLEDVNHKLQAGLIYHLSVQQGQQGPMHQFIWKNHAPPRVKFFGWLLVQERIQSRDNLSLKNIVDDSCCEICQATEETADHIVAHCPFAQEFWKHVGGGNLMCIAPVIELWNSTLPGSMPAPMESTFLLLCCWELWKHRNTVVFRGEQPSLTRLLSNCRASAEDWRCRIPTKAKPFVTIWVYGNSFESSLVAVVNPNKQALERWAESNGVTGDFATICEDPKAKEFVLGELTKMGKEKKLKGFELIRAVHLDPAPFDMERDLITPTYKKKRPQLLKHYQSIIDGMYKSMK